MGNVFLLYMPPGNAQAMVNYEATVKNRVSLSRIAPLVSQDLQARLIKVFGTTPMAVWGSQAGSRNKSSFAKMSQGDDILIVEGDSIKLIGKIAAKVESQALSNDLWRPIAAGSHPTWELVYFIANPRELDVPFSEFCLLFGYAPHYQLQGFTTVAEAKLNEFYGKYDDLYSVLVRIQKGEPVSQKLVLDVAPPADLPELAEIGVAEVDAVLQTPFVSDHTRMQWTLARLGIKAGERIWVPIADQIKLRQAYDFAAFDPEFAAGVDLPHSYIENIDVIWKREFRIGAAYEIENSTSIYSGLLRFTDLNIVAPNTLYPMFVVAPSERKSRISAQVLRPTFRQFELGRKVRFLPYETIDEIDQFFSGSSSGLNVDLILGRSESLI
ncbi:MAG: hypothetical protein ABIP09_03385 [Gemmatimonadaceae bacterium]